MTSSTCTLAPAGARGPVGAAVRPAARFAGSPVAARLRALPALTTGPRPGAAGTAFGRTPAVAVFGTTVAEQQIGMRTTTEHNGTTLGIPSSRRPSS
ncbi:hypothetical protein SAMN06893096_101443 [Geodermatophilus pulveris]|uniref:Uncharacterized protein n=1 Tax=Geodermatophilus pulveris TaxID=1564159 RepID=A0A239B512_9ACTN|nr:hypothetical protein [Geodermatophilus pulveris]SNS02929.1 hypothetical protein SAMN06893096_101443 [Geodermatophilus pulveris]